MDVLSNLAHISLSAHRALETITVIFLYINGDVQYHDFYGNGVVFTTNKEIQYAINILVRPGITLNNVIFKPMITKNIEATYDDYVSYQETFDGSDLLYNNGPQLDASYDMNNLTFSTIENDWWIDKSSITPLFMLSFDILLFTKFFLM